jgi:phenylpropionate dioxygenase-like ring-hydroxylating dioxygenase large terminal subunit
VDDRLQCPFHLWGYDATGACVDIPAGDRPPPNARLFSYPVAESLGIIWAFNGDEPPHPAPHFDQSESELVVDAFRNPLTMQVDSSVVAMNGFDLQHFKVVHGMPIEVDESKIQEDRQTLTLQFKTTAPEFGEMIQQRKLWGVNTVTVESESAGRKLYLLHSLCPVTQNSTQGFLVNATPRAESGADDGDITRMLERTREYSLRLVNEDAPIFNTIKFRADCMTASDRFLRWGIRYLSRYPRAHPGRSLIN